MELPLVVPAERVVELEERVVELEELPLLRVLLELLLVAGRAVPLGLLLGRLTLLLEPFEPLGLLGRVEPLGLLTLPLGRSLGRLWLLGWLTLPDAEPDEVLWFPLVWLMLPAVELGLTDAPSLGLGASGLGASGLGLCPPLKWVAGEPPLS